MISPKRLHAFCHHENDCLNDCCREFVNVASFSTSSNACELAGNLPALGLNDLASTMIHKPFCPLKTARAQDTGSHPYCVNMVAERQCSTPAVWLLASGSTLEVGGNRDAWVQ